MTDPTPDPRPSTPSGSYQNGGGSFGRDLRLVVGALLLLGNAYLIYHDTQVKEALTWEDVALHGGLLVAGLLLMDPKRTLDLIGAAKDYIPFLKKSP